MQVGTHRIGGSVLGALHTQMYPGFTITLTCRAARCFRTSLIYEPAQKQVLRHYGLILLVQHLPERPSKCNTVRAQTRLESVTVFGGLWGLTNHLNTCNLAITRSPM